MRVSLAGLAADIQREDKEQDVQAGGTHHMCVGGVRLHKDLRDAGINQYTIGRSALLVFLERLQNLQSLI